MDIPHKSPGTSEDPHFIFILEGPLSQTPSDSVAKTATFANALLQETHVQPTL